MFLVIVMVLGFIFLTLKIMGVIKKIIKFTVITFLICIVLGSIIDLPKLKLNASANTSTNVIEDVYKDIDENSDYTSDDSNINNIENIDDVTDIDNSSNANSEIKSYLDVINDTPDLQAK